MNESSSFGVLKKPILCPVRYNDVNIISMVKETNTFRRIQIKNISFSSVVKWVYIILFTVLILPEIQAQKVTVSNEINIKLNYSYDIFPDIKGNLLFYHDRGTERLVEVYDENLRYLQTRNIQLPFKQMNIVTVVRSDTFVNIFFQWKEGQQNHLSQVWLDSRGMQSDSFNTIFSQESPYTPNVRFALSEDKSIITFFWIEGKLLHYLQVSNEPDSRILDKGKIDSKEFNFRSDFLGIVVTNEGKLFIIGQKERSWNKSNDPMVMIMVIQNGQYEMGYLSSKESDISQFTFNYDHFNQMLCIAGILGKNGEDAAVGYFVYRFRGFGAGEKLVIEPQLFSLDFISEIYGKKFNKIKKISDLYLQDMVVRRDGGVLLVMEIKKEFLRRAGSSPLSRFGDVYTGRGFMDYYNEDIILVSNNPDGNEHWKKILYKKQFSQDDMAIYSSYFMFVTPSRIKFIYNDEIKSNNTVSEYVIDPMGNFERKSVLSTQYQNLKLRFRDGIQISPNVLIVPSEQINKLNLVKIDYSQGQ
jgi:hypothetical protein